MKGVSRISFLGVPVDNVPKDDLSGILEAMVKDGNRHQIVLLTISRLFQAKRNREYKQLVTDASLVLPVSRGIISGVKFQKKGDMARYNPYEFIIFLLSTIESNAKGVYLLGSEKADLVEAEKNLKASFPAIKIIGRYPGYFNREQEKDIKISIRKSAPALTLSGKGVPGNEKWIYKNIDDFNPGIFLWVDNYLDIFSGKDKNVSKKLFWLGLESFSGIWLKPWRIFKIFPYFYFKFLVLFYKIIGK